MYYIPGNTYVMVNKTDVVLALRAHNLVETYKYMNKKENREQVVVRNWSVGRGHRAAQIECTA